MNWLAQAGVGWLIAALLELTLHWFPWRLALKRVMPWASVAGVFALALPFAGILLLWIKQWQPPLSFTPAEILFRTLVAFVGMVISAILAILSGYFIDWILNQLRQADELSDLLKLKNDQTRKIRHTSRN